MSVLAFVPEAAETEVVLEAEGVVRLRDFDDVESSVRVVNDFGDDWATILLFGLRALARCMAISVADDARAAGLITPLAGLKRTPVVGLRSRRRVV